MSTEPFELRRRRDFGQVIGGAFAFARRHARPLYRAIAIACLPVALLAAFLLGDAYGGLLGLADAGKGPGLFAVILVLAFLLMGAALLLLHALTHEYLRLHDQGEARAATTALLLRRALARLPHYFGIAMLTVLLLGLGSFVLAFLMGFGEPVLSVAAFFGWLAASLAIVAWASLASAAQAFERGAITRSMGRSFALVGGAFWRTLGLWFVLHLLVAMMGYVVQALGLLLMMGLMAFGADEPDALRGWLPAFMAVLFGLQMALALLTYPIPAIGLALHFTSRAEEREGHGLKARLAGFDRL